MNASNVRYAHEATGKLGVAEQRPDKEQRSPLVVFIYAIKQKCA